jgi:methylated-DNA-[protein]-cysteine S-methyltransferase
VGPIDVEASASGVTRVRLAAIDRPREAGDGEALAWARRARDEILDYLAGARSTFSVPLAVVGTDFQRAVWNELLAIPYGQTRTYREVAVTIGRSRSARGVGAACRTNPAPILIPCHRVIASNPAALAEASLKQRLLALELAQAGR